MTKVLFFIQGQVPTAKEQTEIERLKAIPRSRAAWDANGGDDFVEDCDAVYGAYPEPYAKYAIKNEPAKTEVKGKSKPKS